MYSLFYAHAFDDVMKPQDLKFHFLFNEKSFDVIKNIFPSFLKALF